MALTHTSGARNAAANAVVDLLDVGTTDATGDMAFAKADDTVLVTCNFSNPAFGNAASGVATAAAISTGTVGASITSQTIAKVILRDRNNAEVLRGTVAQSSGGDVNLSSVVVSTGDTVSVSSLTYTAPT